MKILLIEDSQALSQSLVRGLRHKGWAVDLASDGSEGLRFALAVDYDAIVLDLMLPKLDGLTLLRRLRERGKKTCVLILSAKDQVADRIAGLNAGADDYLMKPFSFGELQARVKALVRRQYDVRNPRISIGEVDLNTALHTAFCAGEPIPLTPAEQSLFEYLATTRGRVASVHVLQEHLYHSDASVSSNVIEAHVSSLRRKLAKFSQSEPIKTRRGFGYYIE